MTVVWWLTRIEDLGFRPSSKTQQVARLHMKVLMGFYRFSVGVRALSSDFLGFMLLLGLWLRAGLVESLTPHTVGSEWRRERHYHLSTADKI